MSGDIDNAETMAAGEVKAGETELDGDAALFLFLEPVGVRSGECFYQACFTVIDMAGGTKD